MIFDELTSNLWNEFSLYSNLKIWKSLKLDILEHFEHMPLTMDYWVSNYKIICKFGPHHDVVYAVCETSGIFNYTLYN